MGTKHETTYMDQEGNQEISQSSTNPPQHESSLIQSVEELNKHEEESSVSSLIQSVEELNKLEEDTRAFLESSTPFSPSHVNVVTLSNEKIVIEVQLKKSDEDDGVAQESEPDPDKKGNKDSLTDPPNSTKDTASEMRNSSEKCDNLSVPGSNGSRLNRRAVSECGDTVTPIRGILKMHRSVIRRTVSESHAGDEDSEDVFVSSPDVSIDGEERTKKCVHFNDRIYTTTFRPNSSILSRKNKTLKRTLRRKKKLSGSESSSDIESHEKSSSSTEDLLKITDSLSPPSTPTTEKEEKSNVIERKVMVVKPLLQNGTIFTVTPVDDSELDLKEHEVEGNEEAVVSTRAGRQDSGYDSEESREAIDENSNENGNQQVSWQEVKPKNRRRKNRKPHTDQLRKESRVESDQQNERNGIDGVVTNDIQKVISV